MSTRETYQVTGMTCGHCVSAVSDELRRLPGVRDVEVDLDSGVVTVASDGPLPIDEIRAAVDEAGYALAGTGG
jgi:copper chaperone CopZ